MNLKQSQGHQTYNENIDPKQGYNHAVFESPCFNSVQDKRNVQVFFFKQRNICQLSHKNKCENQK